MFFYIQQLISEVEAVVNLAKKLDRTPSTYTTLMCSRHRNRHGDLEKLVTTMSIKQSNKRLEDVMRRETKTRISESLYSVER